MKKTFLFGTLLIIFGFLVMACLCQSHKEIEDNSKDTANYNRLTEEEIDLEQLADFVENSTDEEFFIFLGSIGDYVQEMRRREEQESLKRFLEQRSLGELPNKRHVVRGQSVPNPEGVELHNQFRLFMMEERLLKLRGIILESDHPDLWSVRVIHPAFPRLDLRGNKEIQDFIFDYTPGVTGGRLFEIRIPDYTYVDKNGMWMVFNTDALAVLNQFVEEFGMNLTHWRVGVRGGLVPVDSD